MRKRDGRIEPFDEARIARAVIRAGRHAGRHEEVERLAREISRAVVLFLGGEPAHIPDTARIATALESALEETGHGSIARAARDWRDWRQKRRGEVRVRGEAGPAPEENPAVEVLSPGAARPWTKQRIVQALVQQAELEHETAEDVARAVEERVFAAGLNQISTTLLRELIDAELFERGFSAQLGRLETFGVSKPDLERLAFLAQGRPAIGLEDQVLRGALERWALEQLLGERGAAAHRRGDVHLLGLGRPYRLAAGAVDATALLGSDPGALETVRAWVRAGRAGSLIHELAFGLVGLERPLGACLAREGEPAVRAALELLFEALAAPLGEDGPPPAPELHLVVDLAAGEAEQRATRLLLEVLRARGRRAVGVTLVGRLRDPAAPSGPLVAFLTAAAAGAPCALELGPGEGCWSRATAPGWVVGQLALVNLAGLAIGAGRGERQRFSERLDQALEAALEAAHQRRRRVATWPACPALPLFRGGRDPALAPLEPERQGDALGLVGLFAALRFLVGEGPTENPRVAELAVEVVQEARDRAEAIATRLGLGRVRVEDAGAGDGAVRLAALDLDRFRQDARDLLGDAAGWDAGVALLTAEGEGDLRLRLSVARRLGGSVWLPREVLASEAPEVAAPRILDVLAQRGTARQGRARPGSGRPSSSEMKREGTA